MTSTESIPRGPAVVIGLATLLLVVDDVVPDGLPFDTDVASILAIVALGISAGLLVAPPAPGALSRLRTGAPRFALGLTVSAVTTALLLVASEFAVRWLYRDVTTTADDRGYFSERWSARAVRFNEHGFRERSFGPKPAGTYRIAVMGDSFTFGNGIAEHERYTSLLQHGLGVGFEVLNFGMPGFNTPEISEALRTRVRGFDPDFVLVQWFVNDVEGAGRLRPLYRPLLPAGPHDWLHRHSALYTLLDSWWTRRQIGGGRATSYVEYMTRTFGDPQSPAALDDRRAWRTLTAAAGGLAMGVVLFPDLSQDLGPGYPFAFLHERVLAVCAEARIPCVDLRTEFARVPNRRTLWASRLDAHPGGRANAIAADRIRHTFEPLWLNRVHAQEHP